MTRIPDRIFGVSAFRLRPDPAHENLRNPLRVPGVLPLQEPHDRAVEFAGPGERPDPAVHQFRHGAFCVCGGERRGPRTDVFAEDDRSTNSSGTYSDSRRCPVARRVRLRMSRAIPPSRPRSATKPRRLRQSLVRAPERAITAIVPSTCATAMHDAAPRKSPSQVCCRKGLTRATAIRIIARFPVLVPADCGVLYSAAVQRRRNRLQRARSSVG